MSYIAAAARDAKRLKQFQDGTAEKLKRLDMYGPSSRQAFNMAISPDPLKAAKGKAWLDARKADGYTGRGRYRRRRRYRGRGAYYGGRGAFSLAKAGSQLSKFGRHMTTRSQRRTLGNMALQGAAGLMGAVPVATGVGDYNTGLISASNNIVTDGNSAGSVPSFASSVDEQGDITISHSEYVGDIFGNSSGTLFSNAEYALNPGIEKTFPWLSQLAANFTEYEFIQLMFTFRSTVSDIGSSSNGQVGTIIMATQYNPDESAFVDKSTMMQYAHSNSDKSTSSQIHGVECDPAMNAGPAVKYVRTVPISQVTGDSVRYDQGTFQVAVHGTPSGFDDETIGELWVSYTVRLNKPRLYSGIGNSISQDIFVSNGGESRTDIFGDGADVLAGSENGIGGAYAIVNSQFQYTFPANAHGNYEIIMICEGDLMQYSSTYFNLSGEISVVSDLFASGGRSTDSPNADASVTGDSGRLMTIRHVNVLPNTGTGNNVITMDFALDGGTVNQSTVIVREYNATTSTPPEFVNSSGVVVVP